MVKIQVKDEKLVDFSFMPSLKCNLLCPFCMYKASPDSKIILDIKKTINFISTIDFSRINAIGFYGGEVSVDYDRYQKFIDLVPQNIVKFTITNGTWSINERETKKFIDFALKNKLQVFVSATKFHKLFQNEKLLKKVAKKYKFVLKSEDRIIPMGRAKKKNWTCSKKCLNYICPMRLTLHPSGDIMFCNCDGVYPVVGTYNDDFNAIVRNGLNIKDFCKKLQ